MDYSCNHRRFGTRCCTNIVKCELNCVVNISLTVLEHIVHVSSSNVCSRLIMDYSCNHHRISTRCCTNRVPCNYIVNIQCELNYIVNITLTVLEHMVHMSSSNLCSRLIMDYSCNHRRFGTRGCTNRVQCELNYIVNISFTVLDHIVHMS